MGEDLEKPTVDWHARFVQQARWTEELRRHLFQRLGIDRSQRLLEVGCGTGAILSALTKQQGGVWAVHGLDLNPLFLSQASLYVPSSPLTRGDAHRLPYASHTFDAVLCHFLLLWVADPIEVVSEMARVTKPGGSLLALAEPDYGGRIDYPEALTQLGVWQEQALRQQGAETRLGRRLGALFTSAGLLDVQIGVLGGQWHPSPPSLDDLDQEWAVIESDLHGLVEPHELARLRQVAAQASESGQRLLFVPTFYAWGIKA